MEGEEQEEEQEQGEEQRGRKEVEKELTAAVDKIYELRDIIRSLEVQGEEKTQVHIAQQVWVLVLVPVKLLYVYNLFVFLKLHPRAWKGSDMIVSSSSMKDSTVLTDCQFFGAMQLT